MRIPEGLFKITKEVLRHVLRRPVVGISAVAQTESGQILLIRRSDTGMWALPGGTVEWGETLQETLPRELWEEAGVKHVEPGKLVGVYSAPGRDPRFHAISVVVMARIRAPLGQPSNPAEILEAALFDPEDLPKELSHGNKEMLENALGDRLVWE